MKRSKTYRISEENIEKVTAFVRELEGEIERRKPDPVKLVSQKKYRDILEIAVTESLTAERLRAMISLTRAVEELLGDEIITTPVEKLQL